MPSRRRVALFPVLVLCAALAVDGSQGAHAAGHFLHVGPDSARFLGLGSEPGETQAARFLAAHADVLGLRDVAGELAPPVSRKDAHGWRHLSYGHFVAGLAVDPTPTLAEDPAAGIAVAWVEAETGRGGLVARGSTLLVFREGLTRGASGPDHLAYEVEVGNGGDVREFVYVDAHDGTVVHQITGIHDALTRRVYARAFGGPLLWREGDPLPALDPDVTNLAVFGADTYHFYLNAFGRDSYDGLGSPMSMVRLDDGPSCPNAFASATFTSFCPGVTYDDVVAHEWTHVYTSFTHGLIYEGQPGALNESYSDIFGESVDRVNGPILDGPRTADRCSAVGSGAVALVVNAPAALAGSVLAERADFGPRLDATGVTGGVVLADNGEGDARACTAFGGIANGAALNGHIALVDRGDCLFTEKVANAQAAGATAVIVANNAPGLLVMGGTDATIAIPAALIDRVDGARLKTSLPVPGVDVTLRVAGAPLDPSGRWLIGEEVGGLRDMWDPPCFNNPGKVSDTALYVCDDTVDSGGVHENSGIPNHAFALLVDGGTFNGRTVAGVGLTKAIHVYFRAMTAYQTPLTDFVDHADAIEQSCADLIGAALADPSSGAPSGLALSADDCAQVAAAMAAVEMRGPVCGATTTTTSTLPPGATTSTTLPVPPGTPPGTPSPAFLDDLLQTIADALEATPRAELRRKGLRVRFVAPARGRLRIAAEATVAGRLVTVAKGRVRARRPGAMTFHLRPTPRGRRLLRKTDVSALTLDATFAGKGFLQGARQALTLAP
jgi:thermolysin metallopeptidase-like protein/PA domain-containing protein